MEREYYFEGLSNKNVVYQKNEFADDIVFARFINYMQISLYHKKLDYNKHQAFLKSQEENLSSRGWSVLSDKDGMDHPYFNLSKDYNELDIAISKLTQKQRYVIINHYYKKKSLVKISKELKMKDDAVRQLKLRAILSLKRFLED